MRSRFNTQERHDLNHIIGRVIAVVYGFLSSQFDDWPSINLRGKSRVNPVYSLKVVAPWSFGKEGEGQLERPQSITTSTHGNYIVADKDVVKVFNHNGEFLHSFIPEPGLVI